MSTFHIIVGSVMGTAESVALHVQQLLEAQGHSAYTNLNYQAGDIEKHKSDIILLCSSNTGMGDLPANIAPLLQEFSASPPNIYEQAYAIINLGDSSYPNFAEVATTLDEAFMDLGANKIYESLIIDAMQTDTPAEEAEAWLQSFVEQLSL